MTPEWERERAALRVVLIEAVVMLGHLTESGVSDCEREAAEAIQIRAAQALHPTPKAEP